MTKVNTVSYSVIKPVFVSRRIKELLSFKVPTRLTILNWLLTNNCNVCYMCSACVSTPGILFYFQNKPLTFKKKKYSMETLKYVNQFSSHQGITCKPPVILSLQLYFLHNPQILCPSVIFFLSCTSPISQWKYLYIAAFASRD